MRYFRLIFQREFLFAYRNPAEILNAWIFFLMIISLFPLAISPDPGLLKTIAPGVIWVAILLSTVLHLEKLFQWEHEDGVIEQWILSPQTFLHLIFAKLLSSWCVRYLPLLILLPVLSFWLPISSYTLFILYICILLVTPILHFIGAIFSALTVGLRNSGLLLSLLILPFYVPALIFASSAVAKAQANLPVSGELAFLGAILALTLPLAPLAVSGALKLRR